MPLAKERVIVTIRREVLSSTIRDPEEKIPREVGEHTNIALEENG